MSNDENNVIGGTVITNIEINQDEEVASVNLGNAEYQEEYTPEKLQEMFYELLGKNHKTISDVEEEVEETDSFQELDDDLDLNEMLNEQDFLIVLKTKNPDIQFIIPQLNNFEDFDEETKYNISHNHFLLGFINYALNSEEWIDEYSKIVVQKTQEKFDENFNDVQSLFNIQKNLKSDTFNNLKSLLKDNNLASEAELHTFDEKIINFQAAVEKLNANKPKIIT